MSFWKRRKQGSEQASSPADTGQVQKAKKTAKRSPPVAMEVKILAIEALESGLSAAEVGELAGVGSGTIHKWRKDYTEGGVQGLCRKASSISVRKQCSVLEEKIVALRRANPEHGVRRIRDDLRRHEGIEVSANISSELRVAIVKALKEAKIQIPFPQRDLHLRAVDDTVIFQAKRDGNGVE